MDKATTQYITWKPEYCVGDHLLDKQHQNIFTIINNTYSMMQSGMSKEDIFDQLETVKTYSRTHFHTEEQVMKACAYLDYEAHQRAHRKYERRIDSLTRKQTQQHQTLAYELLSFLKDWWLEHVTDIDQQYAPFIASKSETYKL